MRRDDVQILGTGGQPELVDLCQQLARQTQAAIDVEAIVQIRIVDQPLPAHGGARLFKVDTHHNFQIAGKVLALLTQSLSVLDRRCRIMDRARADHDQQPVVHIVQDPMDRLARVVGG